MCMSERGLGEVKWVTIFGACRSMSECYMRKKKHCIWVEKSCDGRDSSKIFSFQHNSVKSQWICFIPFEHKSNIIPDISVSLEYSVSAGKQSYIDMRSVGGQLHQFPCLASNIINQFLLYVIIELFWKFLSLQNILYHLGNKSIFTWRTLVPPKAKLVHFRQYSIVLLSPFLYTLL